MLSFEKVNMRDNVDTGVFSWIIGIYALLILLKSFSVIGINWIWVITAIIWMPVLFFTIGVFLLGLFVMVLPVIKVFLTKK